MTEIVKIIARDIGAREEHVENVIALIDEGCTIPFIARYRKEQHGSMDDTALRTLEERLNYLRSLEKRREEILRSLEALGVLTPELQSSLDSAETLAALEDIYRPYRPKRRTRATIARERGLQPLADEILLQKSDVPELESLAASYINAENGVLTASDALAGASDIIAETVSDSANARNVLRLAFQRSGSVQVHAARDEDSVYALYYDFSCPVSRLQPHQVLAINRGESEGFLKVSLAVAEQDALPGITRLFVIPGRAYSAFVREAAADAYSRLLLPSVERELRSSFTDTASEGAIKNFALNLKPLLLQPPLKGRVTLGFDPGYRNGCKLAVVDATGRVLDTAVIYPTQPHNRVAEAKKTLTHLIKKHNVTAIALGNGTASRESEELLAELLAELPGVQYAVVSEAGASVYSASKLAAEEFPEYDVNLRSAVSIARRLQDPLSELVKIDPKAIGVGQYQHDMPQQRLSEALDAVVEDCVNSVGADLNTASPSLLGYISGLNKTTARNIVAYREENGPFKRRRELLKVPKLGPKAYEQCAGFLRIPESAQPLDRTGIHPESYSAAEKLLSLLGLSVGDVTHAGIPVIGALAAEHGVELLAAQCSVGVPTLRDIIAELQKPGRDPRDELPKPILRSGDVMEIKDLKPGMQLTGTVRNVIDFGAFVDIGVHQDGLVHISQICNRFIKHPSEVLSVGDVVNVVVLDADAKRGRISLSIKQAKK